MVLLFALAGEYYNTIGIIIHVRALGGINAAVTGVAHSTTPTAFGTAHFNDNNILYHEYIYSIQALVPIVRLMKS